MNYADIKFPDVQDGDGIRVALYVSGCHFRCKECHNKVAWDFNYGKEFTDETIEEIMNMLKEPYVDGLSLLGGEPLEPVNQIGLLPLVKRVREELPEKSIWCWTGYNFDTDIFDKMYAESKITQELLPNIDIIVDGQFEIENKMADLKFRGSTNQRKIDVQASLEKGEMVKLKFGDEARYETKKPKVIYFEEFKKQQKDLTNGGEDNKILVGFDAINFGDQDENEHETIEIKETEQIIAAKNID